MLGASKLKFQAIFSSPSLMMDKKHVGTPTQITNLMSLGTPHPHVFVF
jgi:hypothetical protein